MSFLIVSQETTKDATKLLHSRLGYVGSHFLKKLDISKFSLSSSSGKTSQLSLDIKSLTACDICNSCKQVETINRNPALRSSTILELVHSDTWGKCRIPGIFGSLYFVSFTADSSRESEIFLLKSTKEVNNSFIQYKEKKELQTSCKIKAMRFDGGSEYKSVNFCGINQQISAPYTQHQNGVSERLNRTLVTIARCMLAHSGLPLRFWDAAILTACYLRNRLPLLPNKQSPYEAMNKIEPRVSHLRVWGCVCYVLIDTNDPHRFKLSPTSLKGIFIGYCESTTQYRVYVPTRPGRNKVVTSANVQFFEDSFWDRSTISHEQYGDLETLSEEPANIPTDLHSKNSDSEIDETDYSNIQSLTAPLPSLSSELSIPSTARLITVTPPSSSEPITSLEGTEARTALSSQVTSLSPEILPNIEEPFTPRRSKRTPKPIPPRSAWQPTPRALNVGVETPIPQSYREAIDGPYSNYWQAAIHDGLQSLNEKHVFSFTTHVPHGRKPVGSRWVFSIKSDGRYKARLVAQGFSQIYGVDYLETYSPTMRADSLRILLSIAAFRDWEIHQVDVKTAYLEGDLEEEIFMKSPEGMKGTKYVRLNKALYGLKQSGKAWYAKLDAELSSFDFSKSECDSCIYISRTKQLVIGVYVDDLIICGQEIQSVNEIKANLSSRFPIKDLKEIGTLIGWSISRDRANRILQISQTHYIMDKIRSFGLMDAKPYTSPLEGYKGVLFCLSTKLPIRLYAARMVRELNREYGTGVDPDGCARN
ncbi:hypothetical protein K3495_g14159 [Podosphaera aphanis]|nr:hypothetical protein K3495_g14159 [Podosphaera aphanis]